MIVAENWSRIIGDLEARMTLRDIAAKVGSSPPALCRYKEGDAEPKHSVGEALRALHREKVPLKLIY